MKKYDVVAIAFKVKDTNYFHDDDDLALIAALEKQLLPSVQLDQSRAVRYRRRRTGSQRRRSPLPAFCLRNRPPHR